MHNRAFTNFHIVADKIRSLNKLAIALNGVLIILDKNIKKFPEEYDAIQRKKAFSRKNHKKYSRKLNKEISKFINNNFQECFEILSDELEKSHVEVIHIEP